MATVFVAAVGDKLISDDPTRGVRMPQLRRTEASMTIPTPAQVAALLEAADEDFACFIALCAFAGMRLGEAAGIQVGDVDWMRRTIRLSRQVQRAPGLNNVEVRLPKYGSERTIFAPDALLTMISELIKRRGIADDLEAFLFVGTGGSDNPPHANVIWHRFRPLCKRAGVEGATIHQLRHFYASGLIRRGADVVTVQRAMGHASAAVTLRVYSHLWPMLQTGLGRVPPNSWPMSRGSRTLCGLIRLISLQGKRFRGRRKDDPHPMTGLASVAQLR